jgi:glycosyltransferase involved in cell wall biosynthesis
MISVVMPARNAARTLGDQLEALSNQTYDDRWELVVVNHRSTDATSSVISAFRGRFRDMKSVDTTVPGGPGAARNVGTRAASGSAFVFCDADDVVQPGWLEAHGDSLTRHSAVSGPLWIAPSGAAASDPVVVIKNGLLSLPFEYLPYALTANFGIQREPFEELGRFSESIETGTDVDLSWRLAQGGYSIHFDSRAIVLKRGRPGAAAAFHQQYRRGRDDVDLFRRHHPSGMPRTWRASALQVLIAAIPPRGRRQRRGRHPFATALGKVAGRAVGSARRRRFFI